MLLAYLKDYREVLRRDHLERWEAGALDMNLESEAKGRCNTLFELSELPFSALIEFYQEPEETDA